MQSNNTLVNFYSGVGVNRLSNISAQTDVLSLTVVREKEIQIRFVFISFWSSIITDKRYEKLRGTVYCLSSYSPLFSFFFFGIFRLIPSRGFLCDFLGF